MQISYNIMHNTIQCYINHARHRFYHIIFNFFCNCYCLTEGLRWYYEIPLRTRVISLLLTCCSVLCLSCVPDLAIPRCPMTTEVCRHSCNVSHWRRPSHPHSTFFDYKGFFFEGNMACFCVCTCHMSPPMRKSFCKAWLSKCCRPSRHLSMISQSTAVRDWPQAWPSPPGHCTFMMKRRKAKVFAIFFWIGCPGRHPLLIFFYRFLKHFHFLNPLQLSSYRSIIKTVSLLNSY